MPNWKIRWCSLSLCYLPLITVWQDMSYISITPIKITAYFHQDCIWSFLKQKTCYHCLQQFTSKWKLLSPSTVYAKITNNFWLLQKRNLEFYIIFVALYFHLSTFCPLDYLHYCSCFAILLFIHKKIYTNMSNTAPHLLNPQLLPFSLLNAVPISLSTPCP